MQTWQCPECKTIYTERVTSCECAKVAKPTHDPLTEDFIWPTPTYQPIWIIPQGAYPPYWNWPPQITCDGSTASNTIRIYN